MLLHVVAHFIIQVAILHQVGIRQDQPAAQVVLVVIDHVRGFEPGNATLRIVTVIPLQGLFRTDARGTSVMCELGFGVVGECFAASCLLEIAFLSVNVRFKVDFASYFSLSYIVYWWLRWLDPAHGPLPSFAPEYSKQGRILSVYYGDGSVWLALE